MPVSGSYGPIPADLRSVEGDRPQTADEVRAAGLYVSRSAANFSAALVAIVCSGYGALSYVGVVQNFGLVAAIISATLTAGILGLQLGYFSRPRGALTPLHSAIALPAMAGLVYLPALWLGTFWTGFTGFMAGSLLLALPLRWGMPAYGAVVVASGLMERRFGADDLEPVFATAYAVSSTAITGLVIFGLTRLARLVRDLHDAREELSRMAVAEERLRFSRDAHDLLGMSLSAITLKAELTHRLVLAEPDRARTELDELLGVSRRALGEVRMVASGATSLSLADELWSARSVLRAAEIDTAIRGHDFELPDDVATLFATLLREAVTNILRHSKAEVCTVSVSSSGDTARITVTNDRADEKGALPDDRPDSAHRGIANLRQRFAELGGELTAERDEDQFVVVGRIPLSGAGRSD
ncbi:sensor histidine kinase [Actinomycetospora aeridis]|uniref:Histidine kinase n=1 Tax=Actinomycetospora aeridis TaxID=3129231 RepID=A0ABU8N081_9PSEU